MWKAKTVVMQTTIVIENNVIIMLYLSDIIIFILCFYLYFPYLYYKFIFFFPNFAPNMEKRSHAKHLRIFNFINNKTQPES